MRWVVTVAGVVLGGWMTFDGLRALLVGDYVRLGGRLGPWADLASAAGIEPTSTGMKVAVATIGVAWLIVGVGTVVDVAWWRALAVATAVAGLWYLPFGTILGLVVLGSVWLSRGPGS